MDIPFSYFTLPELRVIQDFAAFHSDGSPVDEDGAISESIQRKVSLMAYAERALLLAKAALQEGHRNVTNSPNPDVEDSTFAAALRTVNQALSFRNDFPVSEDWLVEQARQRGPLVQTPGGDVPG